MSRCYLFFCALVLTSCASMYQPSKQPQESIFVLMHSTGGDPPIASVVSVYDEGAITLRYGRLHLATLTRDELDSIKKIKEDPLFQREVTEAREDNCIECEEIYLNYTHQGDEYSFTIPIKNVSPQLLSFLKTVDSIAKGKFGRHYYSIVK